MSPAVAKKLRRGRLYLFAKVVLLAGKPPAKIRESLIILEAVVCLDGGMKTLCVGLVLVLAIGLAVVNIIPAWASDHGTQALLEVWDLKNKLNQEKTAQEQAAKKQAEIQEKAANKAAYAESRRARIKSIERARGKKVKSWQVLNR